MLSTSASLVADEARSLRAVVLDIVVFPFATSSAPLRASYAVSNRLGGVVGSLLGDGSSFPPSSPVPSRLTFRTALLDLLNEIGAPAAPHSAASVASSARLPTQVPRLLSPPSILLFPPRLQGCRTGLDYSLRQESSAGVGYSGKLGHQALGLALQQRSLGRIPNLARASGRLSSSSTQLAPLQHTRRTMAALDDAIGPFVVGALIAVRSDERDEDQAR